MPYQDAGKEKTSERRSYLQSSLLAAHGQMPRLMDSIEGPNDDPTQSSLNFAKGI